MSARPSWTDAELASLLAQYFGDKLSPCHLEQLRTDVRDAIADRRHRLDNSHAQENNHDNNS